MQLLITRPSEGLVDQYHIKCNDCNEDKAINANKTSHTIDRLQPYTVYKYEVQSIRKVDGLKKLSSVTSGECMTTNGRKQHYFNRSHIFTYILTATGVSFKNVIIPSIVCEMWIRLITPQFRNK